MLGFEKGYSRFACKKELETEQNWNILTPNLWPSALYLSRSPDAQPEALGSTLLGAGFLYCILSASSLDPNSSGPQAPSAWWGFPYHLSLQVALELQLNSLSYIIVQRPLDLWNRMFDRHQADITVMQFRGHSLPMRQSMRVSWDFLACPILLANFRPGDFLSPLPLECVTSFRCITLNGILGWVECQNTTQAVSEILPLQFFYQDYFGIK